jgi:putative endonuclease
MWYVYILECNDGTYYTGLTNNLQKRLLKHNQGKGAKYTRGRLPVKMLKYWNFESKSEAAKEEYYKSLKEI